MRVPCVVLSALLMASCAGRDPHPVDLVQPGDKDLSCTAIYAEISANNDKISDLSSEEGWKVAQNVAAGVTGLFIWPLWFGMDFKDAAGIDRNALEDRNEYLSKAYGPNCSIVADKKDD